MTHLSDIQKRSIADSQYWFPNVHENQQRAVVHFALGIAGEVGELVNLIKKAHRGDWEHEVAARHRDIADEMADVLIYLADMAAELGIDLEQAIDRKRLVLIGRWGDPLAEGQ